jgi:hypothetical protein
MPEKKSELDKIKEGIEENQINYLRDNPQYKGDKEIVLLCVEKFGLALQFAAYHLRRDEEVCLKAITQNGRALEFCSPDIQRNKDFIMRAVKLNGSALQYADKSLKASKEVVMEALKTAGYVLEYASPKLKADREVVLQAMKSAPQLLDQLQQNFKNREFYLDLIAVRPDALLAISASERGISDDMDFVLEAVNRNGAALQHVSPRLKNDMDVVLAALNQNGAALQHVSDTLKDNMDVVLKALNQNGAALQYVSRRLINDPLVLSYAKYSDQPLVLTPAQDTIVIPFLQEKRNSFDSLKKVMVASHSPKNALSRLTAHGLGYQKKFLADMYGSVGLDEKIVFILNKMNPRGGRSKTKKRKIKKNKKTKK